MRDLRWSATGVEPQPLSFKKYHDCRAFQAYDELDLKWLKKARRLSRICSNDPEFVCLYYRGIIPAKVSTDLTKEVAKNKS